jgi:hypothetical protein
VRPLLGARVVLCVLGGALVLYGLQGVLRLPVPDLVGVLWWGALGVVLHDFVWAPVVLALARASERLGAWTRPLQVGALLAVPALLATLPTVLGRPHVTPEPGLLPQSYLLGVLVVVGVGVAAAALTRVLDARRGAQARASSPSRSTNASEPQA